MKKVILGLSLVLSQQVWAADESKGLDYAIPMAHRLDFVELQNDVSAPQNGARRDLLNSGSASAFAKTASLEAWDKYRAQHPVKSAAFVPTVIKRSNYVQATDFCAIHTWSSQSETLSLTRLDTGENQDLNLKDCGTIRGYWFSPVEDYLLVRTDKGLVVYDSLRAKPVLKIWSSELSNIRFSDDITEGWLLYQIGDGVDREFDMMGCSVVAPVELNHNT